MAIENATPLGFTTVTKYREQLVDRSDWSYEQDFGLVPYTKTELAEFFDTLKDEDIIHIVAPQRLGFLQWNCRRSLSENLTNSVALTRGTPVADAVQAVKSKAASLHRGEISNQGGSTMDPFERELRDFTKKWLMARGVPTKTAEDAAKKPLETGVDYAVRMVLDNDTPEERTRIAKLFTTKAQRALDELNEELPEADEASLPKGNNGGAENQASA